MSENRRGAPSSSARSGVVYRRARYACHTAGVRAAHGVELRRRGWRGCSAGSGERMAVGGGQ